MSGAGPLGPIPVLSEDEAGLPGPALGEPSFTPEERRRPFRALRHREFRLLFAAYGIGDLGFWISHISLQSEMARITDNSAGWLGVLFFTTFIPMLLLAPVAGVVADRFDRKVLLMATRAAVGVLAAALAALVLGGVEAPGVLVAFGALFGSMFAFMAPASQAVTANAVPRADLASAISIQSAGNNLSRIAGPALAAPILAVWGAGTAFAVYAVANALMVATLAPIRLSVTPAGHQEGTVWWRWKEGIRHARARPPAIAALVTMSVFSIFGAAHVALFPVFTTDVLDHPRDDFTILVSASGVGAVVGALLTGFRRSVPSLRTAATWLVAFGVAAIAFSLSRSWALSLGLVALMGLCYFSVTTSLNTLLHHLADDDKRGRIMGLFAVAWAGLIPFGGIWMGSVADLGGAPLAVALGAAVCIAYAAGVLGLGARFGARVAARPALGLGGRTP